MSITNGPFSLCQRSPEGTPSKSYFPRENMGFFTVFHIFSYVLPGTRALHLTPPSRCLLMLGLKDGDGFFVAPAVLESHAVDGDPDTQGQKETIHT